jgi:hypothetical protein
MGRGENFLIALVLVVVLGPLLGKAIEHDGRRQGRLVCPSVHETNASRRAISVQRFESP